MGQGQSDAPKSQEICNVENNRRLRLKSRNHNTAKKSCITKVCSPVAAVTWDLMNCPFIQTTQQYKAKLK